MESLETTGAFTCVPERVTVLQSLCRLPLQPAPLTSVLICFPWFLLGPRAEQCNTAQYNSLLWSILHASYHRELIKRWGGRVCCRLRFKGRNWFSGSGGRKEISDRWVRRSERTTPAVVNHGWKEVAKSGGKSKVRVGEQLVFWETMDPFTAQSDWDFIWESKWIVGKPLGPKNRKPNTKLFEQGGNVNISHHKMS